MPFLSPLLLLGLVAVAVPIALHLLHRRTPKPFAFSTLRFLQPAVAQTRRSRRLTQLLLLLLRVLIVALLSLAFAQPRLRSAAWLPAGPRTVVLLLDGSASMLARGAEQSNFDRARAWGLALVRSLGPRDRAALIVTGQRQPHQVFPASSNLALVERTLQDATGGCGTGDLLRDIKAAVADCRARHAADNVELHVFSDFQASTWRAGEAPALGTALRDSEVRLFLNRVECAAAGNAWLSQVTLAPPALLGSGEVTARVTAAADEHYAGSTVLRLTLQGREAAQQGITIAPGASLDAELRAPVTSAADFALGQVTLDSDPLAEDNIRYFALERHAQVPVLLVDGAPATLAENADGFYLARALNPQRLATPPLQARTIAWSEFAGADLGAYAAVMVANPPACDAALALKLELYVENGGLVVLYPGNQGGLPGSLAHFRALAGLGGREETLAQTQRFSLRASAAPAALERECLRVLPKAPAFAGSRRLLLSPAADRGFDTCLALDSGTPLLVRRAHGRGEFWVCALSANRAWSEWPLHPAYVILHQLLVRQSLTRQAKVTSLEVGAAAELRWAGPECELPAVLVPPDGTRPQLSLNRRDASQSFVLQEFDRPGHYRLDLAAASPETRYFAVNLPAAESRLTPVTPGELETQLAPATICQPANQAEALALLANATGGRALWPYLLLVAFLLAVSEELFANYRSWRQGVPAALQQLLKRQRLT